MKKTKEDYMDDDPSKHERDYFGLGAVFQSSGIQRAVRRYNECHTLLLDYCVNVLCSIWLFASSVFRA